MPPPNLPRKLQPGDTLILRVPGDDVGVVAMVVGTADGSIVLETGRLAAEARLLLSGVRVGGEQAVAGGIWLFSARVVRSDLPARRLEVVLDGPGRIEERRGARRINAPSRVVFSALLGGRCSMELLRAEGPANVSGTGMCLRVPDIGLKVGQRFRVHLGCGFTEWTAMLVGFEVVRMHTPMQFWSGAKSVAGRFFQLGAEERLSFVRWQQALEAHLAAHPESDAASVPRSDPDAPHTTTRRAS